MKNWRNAFSILLLAIGLFACLQSFAPAKVERSKVIKKDFASKPDVAALHQYGPLVVKKSADGKVHLTAEMLVTGTDEADMEEVLSRFDIAVQESATSLRLTTDLGIEGCNTINNKMTIKYNDGKKVKGIHDYKVNMTLEVPNPERLLLENKYDRIELVDDYLGELRVKLYSGDLSAANLGGLDLDLKYGKARVQKIWKATLLIYDAEFRSGDLQEMKASTKYSRVEIGNVTGNLTLETYDEHWKAGNVGGKLTLNDKYSDFKFGNIGDAKMMLFDSEFTAEEVGNMEIQDTKYSEYKIRSVGSLTLGNVFDDDYRVQSAGRIKAQDSKYTEYRVERLGKQFTLTQSFDDTVELSAVASDFNQIGIDGKYTELTLSIAEGANFNFVVDMKYGKANYPAKRVNSQKHLEKDNQLQIEGSVGAAGQENSLRLTGFDNTLEWR
jgi:hypothetical protein